MTIRHYIVVVGRVFSAGCLRDEVIAATIVEILLVWSIPSSSSIHRTKDAKSGIFVVIVVVVVDSRCC